MPFQFVADIETLAKARKPPKSAQDDPRQTSMFAPSVGSKLHTAGVRHLEAVRVAAHTRQTEHGTVAVPEHVRIVAKVDDLAEAHRRQAGRPTVEIGPSTPTTTDNKVGKLRGVPSPLPEPPKATRDLGAFAADVNAAAREAMTGRFGDDKVFISHVHKDPRFAGMPRSEFDENLVAALKAGKLQLSRADLAHLLDRGDVESSLVTHGPGAWHFVQHEGKATPKELDLSSHLALYDHMSDLDHEIATAKEAGRRVPPETTRKFNQARREWAETPKEIRSKVEERVRARFKAQDAAAAAAAAQAPSAEDWQARVEREHQERMAARASRTTPEPPRTPEPPPAAETTAEKPKRPRKPKAPKAEPSPEPTPKRGAGDPPKGKGAAAAKKLVDSIDTGIDEWDEDIVSATGIVALGKLNDAIIKANRADNEPLEAWLGEQRKRLINKHKDAYAIRWTRRHMPQHFPSSVAWGAYLLDARHMDTFEQLPKSVQLLAKRIHEDGIAKWDTMYEEHPIEPFGNVSIDVKPTYRAGQKAQYQYKTRIEWDGADGKRQWAVHDPMAGPGWTSHSVPPSDALTWHLKQLTDGHAPLPVVDPEIHAENVGDYIPYSYTRR